MPGNSSPLTTGIAWSDGGDLVVGYGASWFGPGPGFAWRSETEFRCATRRYGEALEDVLVDRQEIIGMDPTVAVLGQGAAMKVFYAYEVRDGVRLSVSEDGGSTFAHGAGWGQAGDHLPTVFARSIGGQTRVDVLFLAPRAEGCELHVARWLAWPASPRQDEELTTASFEPFDPGSWYFGPPGSCVRSTQIGWLGYDAVLDGDQILVVYDQARQSSVFWGPVFVSGGLLAPTVSTFVPASPPPLAAGMTEPARAVDADDDHQLFLMRLN